LFVRARAKHTAQNQSGDLSAWGLKTNEEGHLSVDGRDVLDLVRRFGSPLFVVSRPRLEKDALAIKEAVEELIPGSMTLYSYKTNCVPAILKEIHTLGLGAEVISPYELWLAARLDVPGSMTVYNGVNKTGESIAMAAEMGVLAVNVDHVEEIERLYGVARARKKRIGVGLRLALKASQFGMEIANDEAMDACRRILRLSDCLDLRCVHFNVASNAKNAAFHKSCALRAMEFIAQVKKETGREIAFLDIGGGFGVPTSKNMSGVEYALYRSLGLPPSPPKPENAQPIGLFMKEIASALRGFCTDRNLLLPKLLVEPGRFVTSRCETLLTTVLTIKKKPGGGRTFAITDAGRLSVGFPCDFEYHRLFVADRPHARADRCYQVMGRVCTSADWLFKNLCLPELKAGDVLAIMDAGAYFSSYSSNFAFPRPAVVMVSDGRESVIREEESFEHLTAVDRLGLDGELHPWSVQLAVREGTCHP
jgi:diaminopimelate decarboxylase